MKPICLLAYLIPIWANVFLFQNECFSQPFTLGGINVTPQASTSESKFVEKNAAFLFSNFENAVKYPDHALRMGIQGLVIVKFSITKNGVIHDVKTPHGIGAGCDDAAADFIRNAQDQWQLPDDQTEKYDLTFWVLFGNPSGADFSFSRVQKIKEKTAPLFEQAKYKRVKTLIDLLESNYGYHDPELLELRLRASEKLGKRELACADLEIMEKMGVSIDRSTILNMCNRLHWE